MSRDPVPSGGQLVVPGLTRRLGQTATVMHLRIVAPADLRFQVVNFLESEPAVSNVSWSRRPRFAFAETWCWRMMSGRPPTTWWVVGRSRIGPAVQLILGGSRRARAILGAFASPPFTFLVVHDEPPVHHDVIAQAALMAKHTSYTHRVRPSRRGTKQVACTSTRARSRPWLLSSEPGGQVAEPGWTEWNRGWVQV